MFAEWISHNLLDNRLDAFRYTPQFVEAYSQLLSSPFPNNRLEEIRDELAPINYGILQPREFLTDGVPMVRAVDLQNPFVDRGKVVLVPREIEAPYHRSRLKSEDLLISIAGTLGNIGLCPKGWSLANVNQSVARVRVGKDWDANYVIAFLLSSLGQLLLAREAVGTVQRHLNIEDVREVRIPRVNRNIQKSIGNQIRKAERLREMAELKRFLVTSKIDAWYGAIHLEDNGAFGWLNQDHLSSRRIDAWFNQPKYVKYSDLLHLRSDLMSVSALCRCINTNVNWSSWPATSFDYFEIGGIDDQPGSISSQSVNVLDAPSRAKFAVEPWDVLVSTVRPNLKNVALVPETVERAVCSSGFSVLRASSLENAGYLWACLSHDVATAQLMRWNTGGTYPAIERTVPPGILIPNPGDDEVIETGQMVVDSIRWNTESTALVSAAKDDVEALIFGTLDESRLLKQGDEIESWLESHALPQTSERS